MPILSQQTECSTRAKHYKQNKIWVHEINKFPSSSSHMSVEVTSSLMTLGRIDVLALACVLAQEFLENQNAVQLQFSSHTWKPKSGVQQYTHNTSQGIMGTLHCNYSISQNKSQSEHINSSPGHQIAWLLQTWNRHPTSARSHTL